jgi:hypothetical protein
MSYKLEMTGTVHKIGDIERKANGYQKQFLILYVPDINKEEYSDYFKIEWNKNGTEKIKQANIQEGDIVRVICYLSGSKWQRAQTDPEVFFNNLKGFEIEKQQDDQTEELTPFPMLDKTETSQPDDDLPF